MKRIVSLFLACLMLLGVFAACGKTNTPNTPVTSPDSVTAAPDQSGTASEAEPTQLWRPDEIPDVTDTFDLEGRAVGIINMNNETTYFSMLGYDGQNATMLDLETHDRDIYLSELLNITYKETWFHYDLLNSGTQQLLYSGDFSWDLAHWGTTRLFYGALAGLFYDLNALPYIDQSKAYWAQNVQHTLSINGYQFLGINDFTTERLAGCYCIAFNRQLIEDNHLDDPYDLVDSGNWTLDNFLTLTNAVLRDVNGDGKYTATVDVFGFKMFQQNVVLSFYNGTGNTFVSHDENDYPAFLLGDVEAAQNMWDWLGNHLLNNPAVVFYTNEETPIFSKDEILFDAANLGALNNLRDMKSDFGVLPFPKLNADQQEYYTCGGDGVGGLCVIYTTEIPREIGAFLELGSAYGHQHLVPRFYENDLKRKIARDPKTADMIDLILKNAIYDMQRLGFWFETESIFGKAFWSGASLSTVVAALGERSAAKIDDRIQQFITAMNDRE